MRNLAIVIVVILNIALPVIAQRSQNFNADWKIGDKKMTLPRAWNEEYAFKVRIAKLPDAQVSYTKTFLTPKTWKGKKVFIEFEGARQAAEVFLNGERIGQHENGVMAFGFDLTPYILIGKENVLEVKTDNSWDYKEKGTSTDGEISFQWNNKNFRW